MIDVHTANSHSFLSRVAALLDGDANSPVSRLMDRIASAASAGHVETVDEARTLIDVEPVLLAACIEVMNARLVMLGHEPDLASGVFAELLGEPFPFRAVLAPDGDKAFRIEGFVPATQEGRLLS